MNDALTPQDAPRDPANEITPLGQIIAGALLILFILLPGYILIAWWPDRLPAAKERLKPLYINERFHVRLAGIPDSSGMDTISLAGPVRPVHDSATAGKDSPGLVAKDSLHHTDSTLAPDTTQNAQAGPRPRYATKGLIHINTLLLILVAAAGFLGNMIYITSSFSTFVGAVKFRRSWLLWYFVKPFTAAGLALGVYFVFRGGFLNMSDDGANINIYGLITISILTGLYTDRATLKLGEVVNTIFGFKPDENDHRPDKLHQGLKITGFNPPTLTLGQVNTILITGENLDKQSLVITINDTLVNNPTITASAITFQYQPPATQPALTSVKLIVKDDAGKEYLSAVLKTK
ncbi:MAG TPA: IPT/TIG domain-containing protein [Puia sp.]|nr:IPT/TIG domain-containing protein [Puia sp.]